MIGINEALNNYINLNTQNTRAEFCIVKSANEDGTFNCEPLSGDTEIYNVRTYETALGFIKPAIDSIVTVQFYDNQTCYITNIIDYDVFTLLTNTKSTLASKNQMSIVGRNVDIISISDDMRDITEENILTTKSDLQGNTQSGSINILSTNELNVLGTKRASYGAPIGKTPSGKDIFIRADEDGGAVFGGQKVIVGGGDNIALFIQDGLNPSTTQLTLTDSYTLITSSELKIRKDGASHDVELYTLLQDISNALSIINITLQSITPNPALASIVQTIRLKTDLL